MNVSELGGLIEVVVGEIKEEISLLTFSEGLGTIPETVLRELQLTFFSPCLGLSFLRACLLLKKVESICMDGSGFHAMYRGRCVGR